MSTTENVLLVAAVIVWMLGAWLTPLVIASLKGKNNLVLAGLLIGGVIVWWIGAIRLAKPDSYWARRYYDREKRDRSEARFGAAPHAGAV
jgi:hypothetical protein